MRRTRNLLGVLMVFGAAGAVAALPGCGSPRPAARLPEAPSPRDEDALRAAVEAYYAATDVAGLRAAVEAARAAGPDAAPYHEIAADLARLEARHADEVDHLARALLDPADDAAPLHLVRLTELSWTLDQRARVEALLEALAAGHPDAEVRALAALHRAESLHLRGDAAERDAAVAAAGVHLPLAVIGTWDNDQGRGFDAVLPPEQQIDLAGRYPGELVEIGWRTDYAVDPRARIDLGSLMQPDLWQVAYAAGAVEIPAAGTYELRISTSQPVKVWVNGSPVLVARQVNGWLRDGFVLPVTLRAGANTVLVKSAQGVGDWLLAVRLTRPGGAPPGDVRALPADAAAASGAPPVERPWTPAALLERRVAALPEGSARRRFHQATWASRTGLRVPAVALAETLVDAHPRSITARYLLAEVLWENQERGRTADLLADLGREAGDALVYLKLQQARFWQQQHLTEKARQLLTALKDTHPDRPLVWLRLAEAFKLEAWNEDRCHALEEADRRWPRWPQVQIELARCYESLSLDARAESAYRSVLAELPNHLDALGGLQWLYQGNQDLEAAAEYGERLAAAWPHLLWPLGRLGDTLRRMGDPERARARLRRIVELAPTDPDGYARLAALLYEQGRREEAVRLWREALQRDPENEGLANRLAFLAPEKKGPWFADVPTVETLDAAVAGREGIRAVPGADVVHLLEDEVTELKADGSTVNYVTIVAHAVNAAGRDRLTQMYLRQDGRVRILHAYAVGPDGRRMEASSIRGGAVRFRQLAEGATVVLQYRLDSPPDGFLAGHLGRQWWFQTPGVQTVRGRWVLWMPKGTPLHEERRGDVAREERAVGDLVRVTWSATDQPPLVLEPGMPTPHETAAYVVASTVPGWETYEEWIEALLQDAFRDSPEVVALAERLFAGVDDPQEKVRRIHAFTMAEIRYQQDYEAPVMGVKPHPAPMVLARRYGDCKDKAVLFITLARLAGIEVHFALVRTRSAGPVWRDVPMQQFNHAIVYVPPQPGIPEGRFYDPTVDALDVDVLRADDQGTWSLVYDPGTHEQTWRFIPFQDPAVDRATIASVVTLRPDGSAAAVAEVTARGELGSTIRTTARNVEEFAQFLQTQLAAFQPGARVAHPEPVQVEDIMRPARVRVTYEAPTMGRREGRQLRLKVPVPWSPQSYFALAERRHPVVLGAPRTLSWRTELVPPPGARLERLPQSTHLAGDCLRLTREVTPGPDRVVVEQTVEIACERLDTAAYRAHRPVAEAMMRAIEEEVVFTLPPGATPPRAAPPSADSLGAAPPARSAPGCVGACPPATGARPPAVGTPGAGSRGRQP